MTKQELDMFKLINFKPLELIDHLKNFNTFLTIQTMKHRHQLSPVPEESLQFGIRNPSQLATGKSRFSS